MNKTALKDIVREIKSNKGRFFSIFALLFISMVAFNGLFHASSLFEITAEHHYEETNLQDITITSTLGLAERDEFIISQNSHVEDFEMSKSVDVFIVDTNEIIRIESVPQRLATLKIKDGRLPEKNSEIALSYDYFNDKIQLGDKITFTNSENDTDINELKESTFEIVGLVRSPEYLPTQPRNISTVGSGTITSFGYVGEEVFDVDYYTKAKITGTGLYELNSFFEEYMDKVEIFRQELEDDFVDRPSTRVKEVRADGEKAIKEAEEEIEDAKIELEEARQELEDAKAELSDAEAELREAELDIKQGEIDLKEGRLDLDKGWQEYYDGIEELNSEEAKARKEIANAKVELQDAKIKLEDGRREYEDGKKKLDEAKEEFEKGEKLYNDNLKVYQDGLNELNEMKEKIRISREIALGKLNEKKSKDELESEIQRLTGEVEAHRINLQNYRSQLEYNLNILESTEDKLEVETKIADLNNLIEQEETNYKNKSEKLVDTKNALESFETVQEEGRLGDQVIEYSGEAIEQAEKELADGKKQLDEAKEKLEKGRKELQDGIKELEDARIELEDGERKYQDGIIELRDAEETLERELADGRQKLADGLADLEQGEKDLIEGRQKLEDGKKDYEEGLEKYRDGLEEYTEGKEEFDEKSEEAYEEIEKGERDLEKARKDLLKLKEPSFIVETRNGDATYDMIHNNPKSLRILAVVFSVLALLVALLVAFTTMTRMVDERRVLIGTYKGLGYENKVIAAKFVIFGGVSGLAGMAFGNLAGEYILAPLIYRIYMEGTVFIDPINEFSGILFVIGLFLTIITTSLSAYLSVNKSLKENTASLLRPKAPKAGSRIILERIGFIWNRLGFMNKITARNIFRYKGRMFMTIAGVAVCMALMILGFGMKNSIYSIGEIQFDIIQQEDLMLSLMEELDDKDLEDTLAEIENHENIDKTANTNMRVFKLQIPDSSTQDVNLYIALDDKIEDMITFRDRETQKSIPLTDEGILVTEKLANLLEVKEGEDIPITIENQDADLKVSAIIENYLGHNIYISENYFDENFDLEHDPNLILVEFIDDSKEASDETAEELLKNDNIIGTISTKLAKDMMDDTIDSLNLIIIIIVFIAMLLSLTVLYNLTNINVSERIRELSTMKVLGFYPKELTEYVYKETFILSIIGIFFGSFLGRVIVEFVMEAFAPKFMMFGDPRYMFTYLISGVLTIVFTLIVMVLMHIKLKDIDMVEALKSVD